ncbi:MAG: type III pantothenate kinase [Eubacteriales bacterium]|nr:type III pantothenate kinase [Eubacteriales bacterium]
MRKKGSKTEVMFIAIDVGNTHIVFGAMEEDRILFSSRVTTDRRKTSDEYAGVFRNLIHMHHMSTRDIEGGIISSVVPSLREILKEAVYEISGAECMVVGPGVKNGLKLCVDAPAQVGADRVTDAVGAVSEYPLPILIIDMGTATTFSVVNEKKEFLGGLIMPGVMVSLDALVSGTSQLPQISLAEKPTRVIGKNTIECMRHGAQYGNAAMIDGVIDRVTEELGKRPTVVATGGNSRYIIPYCRQEIIVDRDLLVKGLRKIYFMNRKNK